MTHPTPTPSDQPPNALAIAQLVQQTIHQTAALQAAETGWKAVKLQQTQTLLAAALEAVQIVVEADPEWDDPAWEALLREATAPAPGYSTGE